MCSYKENNVVALKKSVNITGKPMRWRYRILYFLFFFLKIYTILAILENLGKKANLGLKLGVLIFLLLKS